MADEFLLLNGRAGWRAALLSKVLLDEYDATALGTTALSTTLQLRKLPGSGRPLVDRAGSLGGLVLPAGVAADGEGRIYILDGGAHVVKRYDPCDEAFITLPCIGAKGSAPRQLMQPQGLAISPRNNLYVADTGNRRVQVFALKDLVLRHIWPSPAAAQLAQPWQPTDIAVDANCRAYVCDYANGLIHVFDSTGRWRAAYDGSAGDPPQPALEKPTRIALDKANRLYVLQEGKDVVVVLDGAGHFVKEVQRPAEIKGDFCPLGITVGEDGTLYISDRVSRRVYACVCDDPCGSTRVTASPARGILAACPTLAFDCSGMLLIGDAESRCVYYVEPKAVYEMEGVFLSEPLDSEMYQCQWHRIAMRAQVPAGTQVRVDTFTSETPLSLAELLDLPEARWTTGQFNAQVGDARWDCLVLSPPGRYLWLRLTLMGDSTATPLLQWVQAHYPRQGQTSLRFLPAVYSQDAEGRDFLGRFLSIFDRIHADIADVIGNIARYFDPMAVPTSSNARADFLGWLAGWLDLVLDRQLPEWRKRTLLFNAHRLFALRGTPEGLRLHIWLYFGVQARILEHFKLRRWLFVGAGRLGEQSAVYGQSIVRRLQLDQFSHIGEFQLIDTGDPLRDPFHVYAHQFTVVVPLCVPDGVEMSAAQRLALDRIVETSKPAHTQANVRVLKPRFRLDGQTYLGLDTVIGTYPDRLSVEGAAQSTSDGNSLGYDSVLGPSRDEQQPPTLRIGKRSQIGVTTRLD